MEIMRAVLGLEDGTCVVGEGFGAEGEVSGELVFSTQMTGYMEALTDPSYHGQILMFTYPMMREITGWISIISSIPACGRWDVSPAKYARNLNTNPPFFHILKNPASPVSMAWIPGCSR